MFNKFAILFSLIIIISCNNNKYEEGYEDGFMDGQNEGYQIGLEEGRIKGLRERANQGFYCYECDDIKFDFRY